MSEKYRSIIQIKNRKEKYQKLKKYFHKENRRLDKLFLEIESWIEENNLICRKFRCFDNEIEFYINIGKKGSIPLGWNMNCQQIKY